MAEAKKVIKIEYNGHPRINSVTHKFQGTVSWEEALERVIINRQKRLKMID